MIIKKSPSSLYQLLICALGAYTYRCGRQIFVVVDVDLLPTDVTIKGVINWLVFSFTF